MQRVGDTLWVYIPLPKLLHEKFMVDENKLFAEEVKEKLINILTSISRVILSADRTPQFYCLFVSDIELGIDYGLIGYVQDLKKSSAGFIPYTEADRRYVIKFNTAPEAIGDKTGAHLELYDIKFTDFLSTQITQRVSAKFQGEELKPYFKVEAVEGKYQDGVFAFSYKIIELAPPQKPIDIQEEILKIIAYCLRTYEFSDFSKLSLVDLSTGNQTVLGKFVLDELRGF